MLPKSDTGLYQLENEITGAVAHHSATRHQLESLVAEVCLYYDVPEPPIRFINSRKEQHVAWYSNSEIVLNRAREGANGWTVLHELAHCITDEFYTCVPHHGREFVAIYMHLLDRWGYLPNRCFRLLAKKHRLKIGRRYRPIAFRSRK